MGLDLDLGGPRLCLGVLFLDILCSRLVLLGGCLLVGYLPSLVFLGGSLVGLLFSGGGGSLSSLVVS